MKCPNCGIPAADGALDCPGCGVVFAKWRPPQARLPDPPPYTAGEGGSSGGYFWILLVTGVLILAVHRGYKLYAAKGEAKKQAVAAAEQARAAEEEEKRLRREEQAGQRASASGDAAAAREARNAAMFPAGAIPAPNRLNDPAFSEKFKADSQARMEELKRQARENPKKRDYRYMDADARRANETADKQLKGKNQK